MTLKHFFIFGIILFINACGAGTPQKKLTLADVDVIENQSKNTAKASLHSSNDHIRKAYAEYLKHASKNDKSRSAAISRLAELEFKLSNKILHEKTSLEENNLETIDATYISRLESTITLITTSLHEYPDSNQNDRLLYNLANAYDQLEKSDQSIEALNVIIHKYPQSRYFLESQFRVAEDHFSKGNFIAAEDGYTNIIATPKNDRFIEKAYLKRGWSRLKLEYYHEAIDDFLNTVAYHGFGDINDLAPAEKDVFHEYFRAIGLAFSYMDDADEIEKYFRNTPDFEYLYEIYASISNIYLKQSRYSDSANTLIRFTRLYPSSPRAPESAAGIIESWRQGGFTQKTYNAIESYYNTYNTDSSFWHQVTITSKKLKQVSDSLKKYIMLMIAHHHKNFQSTPSNNTFLEADKWYQRYFKHYIQYSRKDNLHYQYAMLLSEHNNPNAALYHFEMSAYDGSIILNKKAAYQTILTTSILYKYAENDLDKKQLLDKHLRYSNLYTQLYPNDEYSMNVVIHASELAFKAQRYTEVISLSYLIENNFDPNRREDIKIIRGHAHFELKEFELAESTYKSIIDSPQPSHKTLYQIKNRLALAIYKQGESEYQLGNIDNAILHFSRIANVIPDSDIASAGLQEAVKLAMDNKQWSVAINLINDFQDRFPGHELNKKMSKTLSLAYLNNGQEIHAAKEYEKLANSDADLVAKMAAQWKAAELYESNDQINSAISAYQQFADTYRRPYPQRLEAMQKLVGLYESKDETPNADLWRHNIVNADRAIPRENKTPRTNLIASLAALELAKDEFEAYKKINLTLPLKQSLDKKKLFMQKAVRYFGQASAYGIAETATQAKHRIAEIYQMFSHALLNSQRPKGLSVDEREQYNILLEDQAFPFEEKAIEFFEANLSHAKDGIYDDWVRLSHSQLKLLFPGRYQRETKTDAYINVLH